MKIGECAYCGALGEIHNDHIPPKNLFPKPRPANLITVPSCEECNQGRAKDDEYFRIIMISLQGTDKHEATERVVGVAAKGLGRPESSGFRNHIQQSFVNMPAFTEAGLYLGLQPAISFDSSRIIHVIEYIVKGLFFHYSGPQSQDHFPAKIRLDSGNWDQSCNKGLPSGKLSLMTTRFCANTGGQPHVEDHYTTLSLDGQLPGAAPTEALETPTSASLASQ